MSAAVAVAAKSQTTHLPPSSSSSRHSPMDSKAAPIKLEDNLIITAVVKDTFNSDAAPIVKEPPCEAEARNSNEQAQPLAPPPRPTQASSQQAGENVDYFSTQPDSFSREPNPFEQSFGNPSTDAPANKSLLPPVASLTSPAPTVGDGPSGAYNFSSSLRSGPLSPAMLGGPVGANDYFDPALRGTNFGAGVTPNESSLRTGLTPGGGGSMFPAPSPNSTTLFQQIGSGGATPSTLDFHRTAVSAAATLKGNTYRTNGSSAQDEKRAPVAPMDPQLQQQVPQATFGQHDNDAANGLFMLAQATGSQGNNQFAVSSAQSASTNQQGNETSPTTGQGLRNGSMADSVQGRGEGSDSGDQGKPTTRLRGKRTATGKTSAASNVRRKAEEAPVKQLSAKKAKTNVSMQLDMEMDSEDEEQPDIKEEQYHENGKKMTDDEKRKNFLERNRVAALKCRQRKKQWLANLQAKVEIFSSENDNLTAQVNALRDEIMSLKTALLQHKDCPISQSQGLAGYFSQESFNPHANPYGMGISNGQVGMGQRR